MFTGRTPGEHGARVDRAYAGPWPTLAEHLAENGRSTAGFVANFGMCNACYGVGRGFDTYVDFTFNQDVTPFLVLYNSSLGRAALTLLDKLGSPIDWRPLYPHHPSARTIDDRAMRWLGELKAKEGRRHAARLAIDAGEGALVSAVRKAEDPHLLPFLPLSATENGFHIEGLGHNIPFLSALMQHPRWREGRLSTGFIAEEFPKGFSARAPEGEVARRLAGVAAAIDHVLGERKRQISGQMNGRVVQRERRRAVWLDREEISLDVAREGEGILVHFVGADGTLASPHLLESRWKPGDAVWQGSINGLPGAVQVRFIANGFRLAHRGFEVSAYVFTASEATAARLMPVVTAADTGKKLLCPMPGLVVSIAVDEGQEVKAGETLAVVEAMKMQNVLRAERDGTVKKIHASPGATLAVDALILEFA